MCLIVKQNLIIIFQHIYLTGAMQEGQTYSKTGSPLHLYDLSDLSSPLPSENIWPVWQTVADTNLYFILYLHSDYFCRDLLQDLKAFQGMSSVPVWPTELQLCSNIDTYIHMYVCMHICIINNVILLRLHSNLTVNNVSRPKWCHVSLALIHTTTISALWHKNKLCSFALLRD